MTLSAEFLTPEFLTTLRCHRDRLIKDRTDITAVIEGIEGVLRLYDAPKPDGRAPKARPKVKPTTKTPAKKSGPGRGPKPTWDVERGRRLWDQGKSYRAIAVAVGKPAAAISTYARNHWPKRGAKRKDPLAGRRNVTATTCPNCDHTTIFDPCQHCHTHLPTALRKDS